MLAISSFAAALDVIPNYCYIIVIFLLLSLLLLLYYCSEFQNSCDIPSGNHPLRQWLQVSLTFMCLFLPQLCSVSSVNPKCNATANNIDNNHSFSLPSFQPKRTAEWIIICLCSLLYLHNLHIVHE